jgi:cytoskeletal protein RodZ
LKDMTLAVIVGLWALLLPGFILGESTVSPNPVLVQETAPQQDSQQAPKPSEPAPQPASPEAGVGSQQPETSAQPPAGPKPKKHTHKKKKPATQASDPPDKVVIRNGSTTEPDVKLSQPMSQKQSSNQIQKADDLLAGTESNLQRISERTLNATQQETVKQIHQYMDQARKAMGEGDLDRGRNLAFKAHLLSDDLLKH